MRWLLSFLLPLGPARFPERDVGVGVAGVALEELEDGCFVCCLVFCG